MQFYEYCCVLKNFISVNYMQLHYKLSYNTEATIQYNTIQYNTIQYNTIQNETIQYNTINYKCYNSLYNAK